MKEKYTNPRKIIIIIKIKIYRRIRYLSLPLNLWPTYFLRFVEHETSLRQREIQL